MTEPRIRARGASTGTGRAHPSQPDAPRPAVSGLLDSLFIHAVSMKVGLDGARAVLSERTENPFMLATLASP